MSRLPPIPKDQLPADKQPAYDTLSEITEKSFGDAFKYKDAQGGFVGPFPVFLQQSGVGITAMKCFGEMSKIPGLPSDARETAILAAGAVYKSRYELYAHGNVAIKKVGMDATVIQKIIDGEKPQGLNEECEVAYDVAVHLAGRPGPLEAGLWDRAVKAFGKDGAVALVHFVGFYAYTSILLNAIDAPVPEDEESKVKV